MVGAQMFTLREFAKTADDLARTLGRVSEIGYCASGVSAIGAMNGDDPEVSAEVARKMLDEDGLSCAAPHRNWEQLLTDTNREIEFHQTLGCSYLAIRSLEGE
ncbi:MAG TPA: hypothetical protein DCR55_05480 [Lentisphaeria bacterium]|jgi:hypothetical protein|nr:hypothetical protein [Lentisphaeria bacterium]